MVYKSSNSYICYMKTNPANEGVKKRIRFKKYKTETVLKNLLLIISRIKDDKSNIVNKPFTLQRKFKRLKKQSVCKHRYIINKHME